MIKIFTTLLFAALIFSGHQVMGQCAGAQGNETSYGNNSWRGYAYDGTSGFNSTNYQGYFTETETFDESFCGDNCSFTINGCSVNTETFSVRFKMGKNFTAGLYKITIGGDDGVRLSVDGGSSYLINGYFDQSYTTYSANVWLSGPTFLVLEYYEAASQNRLSFTYTYLGSSYGGEVAASQDLCGSGVIDPAAFTSMESAYFTGSSTTTYRWQVSADNSSWSDISGATSLTYDIPSGFPAGTTAYYRRRAVNNGNTEYSNTVTVRAQAPTGDQVSYGSSAWIGYVYDGANNFSSNYVGMISEGSTFDEDFGGDYVNKATSGCDVYTETFSVRFKMRKTLGCGDYVFTIGADDGVRLSIDGDATYLVNDYSDHGYRTQTSSTISLPAGTYDFVLEYYENGGGNRVSFNYAYTANCAMPISLTKLYAREEGNHVQVTWTTASEENNQGFYVERAGSDLKFESIGFVAGYGTSNSKIDYTFSDSQPLVGTAYYRLRQVDYNETSSYSPVGMVNIQAPASITVYPNPATDFIHIDYPSNVKSPLQVWLVDGSGGQFQLKANDGDEGTFRVSSIARGIYVLIIKTANHTEQRRMILK